jgi:hypothetical protein
MGRISRGIRLTSISLTMARDDPGMVAIPAIAGAACLVVLGVAAAFDWAVRGATPGGMGHQSTQPVDVVVGALAAFLIVFASVLARATIACLAMARLRGTTMTNRQAWSAAASKSHHLLGWALVSTVVGSLVRALQNEGGIFGEILGSIVGFAWSAVTFFVVPVIVFEDLGPIDSIRRSARLFRQRWGEEFVGNGAVGLLALAAVLVLAAVSALLAVIFVPLGVGVFVVGAVAIGLFASVVSGVFNTALYHYATTGQPGLGFDESDLGGAFRSRRRRPFGS